MKKLLLGAAAILAGLSAGVDAEVSVTGIKHLKFSTTAGLVGRSETTGHIVRGFGNDDTSAGFEIIDGNASFSEEEIRAAVISYENISSGFFDNYPNLPDDIASYSILGLNESSTDAEYIDLAEELLASAEAQLRGESVVLSSGNGYQAKGIAGNFFVFAEGQKSNRTVYRCELSNIVSDIAVYKSTCDTIITNQNDSGLARFLDPVFTRFVNNSGYVVYPPSYDDINNYTLVYPVGTVFSIPRGLEGTPAVYISDGESPTLYNNENAYSLLPAGPVLNPSKSLPDAQVVLFGESDKYNYFVSGFAADLGTIPKYTVCKKGDELTLSNDPGLKVERFKEADALAYILSDSNLDPLAKSVLETYPSLPSNEVLAAAAAAGYPFYVGMPESEYQEMIATGLDQVSQEFWTLDDMQLSLSNEQVSVYCSDQVHNGIHSLVAANPFGLLSDTGIYAAPVGATSARGYYLKDFADGEGISIYKEVANYMLNSLSENNKEILINQLILENEYFDSYPGYTTSTFNTVRKNYESGSDYKSTLEESVDQKRGELILETIGSNIGSSIATLDNNGEFTFATSAFTKDIWVVSTSTGNDPVEIIVSPQDLTIDPYVNPNSQFTIDVSGSDIFGLSVSCNISSTALSITEANYEGLFGSQNSFTIPLMFDPSSVTGTEVLLAPELPFSGTGQFILADIIADFTPEDVEITCEAEATDINGQSLRVTSIPATIRISDGIHGGTGTISGTIEILDITDVSGVEVVLTTADGRQFSIITDETGYFEFEGLLDNEFTISLVAENFVQGCQAASVADGGLVELGTIELLAGDVNADGIIDILDLIYVGERQGSAIADSDYDAKADLNRDDIINLNDISIVGRNYEASQCNALDQ